MILAKVRILVCALILGLGFSLLVAAGARAADLAPAPGPVAYLPDLRFHNPFARCDKDCLLGIYGGPLVTSAMYDIFIRKHIMPWDWHYKDSTLISGTIDRPLVTYGRHFEIDAELGIGKRFGYLTQGEVWGALYFRFKRFPWDDYVRTTVGISTGLNYATSVPEYEVLRSHGRGNNVLHYLSPELTLGLPQYPDLDFVARLHHRSGGELGIFNHTGGGAQYGQIGFRYRL